MSYLVARLRRLAALAALGAGASAQPWQQYATPADAGWSEAKLAAAREFACEIGSAAVFVVVAGHALLAWGEVERRFECHSVRKSVLSALLGAHVAAGRLDLDATLADLGIDDEPPLSAEEKQARVRHLLTSTSGVYHPAAKETPDMKRERPHRGSAEPGARFVYNNWDFNVLGVLLAKTAGRAVADELAAQLGEPLGMEDLRPRDAILQLEPSSSVHPAYAFRLSARDLARFGWMIADGGRFAGRQVVPAAWVAESTSGHVDAGQGRRYGYMWWVYPARSFGDSARLPALDGHDHVGALGTGGQLVLVIRSAELVFVHRGDTDNERPVRGPQVWQLAERILAARESAPRATPALRPLQIERLPHVLPAPPEHEAVAIDAAQLPEFVGDYAGDTGVRARVHVSAGRLFVLVPGLVEIELLAEAKDRFFAAGVNLTVTFLRDADGAVVGAEVQQPSGPLRLQRQR